MILNREFLKSLNPCIDRWGNYLKHYAEWSGTWLEFFELEHLSVKDKLWVFTREIHEIEKQQREFAFLCADRAFSKSTVDEIKEFFTLVLFIYESGELDLLKSSEYRAVYRTAYWAAYRAAYWSADSAADSAAYWAAYWAADSAADSSAYSSAYWAAYWAADSSAERKTQLEIAKYVMSEVAE